MSQSVRTPARAAIFVVCGVAAVGLTAVFPGLVALIAIVLAIVGVGGYRWRWAALAVCALLVMALTAPVRFHIRDEEGGSTTSHSVVRE
jgi:uncharacterized membrane protein YqjE